MSIASENFCNNNIQSLYDESDSDIESETINNEEKTINIYTIEYTNNSENKSSSSSSENLSFILTEKQLHHSGLFLTMKDLDSDDKVFPISSSCMNIYSYTKCMEYLIYHENREIELPLKPLRSKIFSELWKDFWDVEFINKIYDESIQCDKLYDLVQAANYFAIKPLIFLILSKIATVVKNAKYYEIDDLLGLNKI